MKITVKKTRGQSLVEFALLFPVLVLLLMFMIDFGRAVYYYSSVYNAAREGARYAIIFPSDTAGINNAAREKAIGLSATDLTVTTTHPTAKTVEVTVAYQFQAVTPIIWNLLASNPLQLQSSSTMEIEQ